MGEVVWSGLGVWVHRFGSQMEALLYKQVLVRSRRPMELILMVGFMPLALLLTFAIEEILKVTLTPGENRVSSVVAAIGMIALPTFMAIALAVIGIMHLGSAAEEKGAQLASNLRRIGMYESSYQVSWLASASVLGLASAVVTVLLGLALVVQPFVTGNFLAAVLLLWFSFTAQCSFYQLLSCFFTSSTSLNIVGALVVMITVVTGTVNAAIGAAAWGCGVLTYGFDIAVYMRNSSVVSVLLCVFAPTFHLGRGIYLMLGSTGHADYSQVGLWGADASDPHLKGFTWADMGGPLNQADIADVWCPPVTLEGPRIGNGGNVNATGGLNSSDFKVTQEMLDRASSRMAFENGLPGYGDILGTLVGLTLLFFILSWYAAQVWADESGAPLPPLFFLDVGYWGLDAALGPTEEDKRRARGETLNRERQLSAEQGDVRTHKLSHSYSGNTALREVNLVLKKGEIFCLLGQNGAGKSTFVNCMSGLHTPTSGEGWVAGISVRDDLPRLRDAIGICPQHDYLWAEFTAREHCVMYSRFRGKSWGDAAAEAERVLRDVKLEDAADRRVPTYSGGMRRRLSVGLATVGDPVALFLDEPSTGMDPLNRRRTWSILQDLKEERIMLLTTHSMEEADALGDTIAIMSLGRVRALGTSLFLKEKYGTGYLVNFTGLPRQISSPSAASRGHPLAAQAGGTALPMDLKAEEVQSVSEVMNEARRLLRGAALNTDGVGGSTAVSIPRLNAAGGLPKFLEYMESGRAPVREWGLSQTTLEEVFLKLVVSNTEINAGGEDSRGSQLVEDYEVAPFEAGLQLILDETGAQKEKVFEIIATLASVPAPGRPSAREVVEGIISRGWILAEASAKEIETVEGQQQQQQQPMPPYDHQHPQQQGGYFAPPPPSFQALPACGTYKSSFGSQVVAVVEKCWTYFLRQFWTNVALAGFILVCVLIASLVLGDPSTGSISREQTNLEATVRVGTLVRFMFFSTGILIPIFANQQADERETGVVGVVQLMGLRSSAYWAGTILYNFAFFTLCNLFFLGVTYIAASGKGPLFDGMGAGVLIAILLSWFCMVEGMVMLSSALLSARVSNIINTLLVFLMPNIADPLNGSLEDWPDYLACIPHLGYYRSLSLGTGHNLESMKLDDSTDPEAEMTRFVVIGAATGLALALMGMYLHEVLPAKYKAAAHPLFFILPLLEGEKTKGEGPVAEPDVSQSSVDLELELEDSDVAAERRKAERWASHDGSLSGPPPLILLSGMRKRFGDVEVVRGVDLAVGSGECFGLLGPNGAGKTTTVSLLTGSEVGATGVARVAGLDMAGDLATSKSVQEVKNVVGICPQFDATYEDLTVEEHIRLLSGVKGVPRDELYAHVRVVAEAVGLDGDPFWKRSKELSGGMRRRLTIAMAMCGSPHALFLDEPTTGLDPDTRQSIWQVIRRARERCTVLLTTHSMSEADALCTRLAIMSQGRLRCVGEPLHLKNKFNEGMRLRMSLQDPGRADEVTRFVKERIFPNALLAFEFGGIREYLLPQAGKKKQREDGEPEGEGTEGQGSTGRARWKSLAEGVRISRVFEIMEREKAGLGVRQWGLSEMSLEEVFVKIVEEAEGLGGAGN